MHRHEAAAFAASRGFLSAPEALFAWPAVILCRLSAAGRVADRARIRPIEAGAVACKLRPLGAADAANLVQLAVAPLFNAAVEPN